MARKTSRLTRSKKVTRKSSRAPRVKSRKSRKSSIRKTRKTRKSRKSRKSSTRMSRKKCQKLVSKKIAINIDEGRWGRKQAIAISYAQIAKMYPKCKPLLKQ